MADNFSMPTFEQYRQAVCSSPKYRRYHEYLLSPYVQFQPRPDRPELFDEQTGFVCATERVAICLGGNGSGKTVAAAKKVAKKLREETPPRERCPYWVVGETYDLSCAVCWDEKLSKFIPEEMIHSVRWYDHGRNWPYAVLLRHPQNPETVGWVIEFKSFTQGRHRMQARSIGGAWINEQAPMEIVEEVLARTRDYGGQVILDFTPLKPDAEWPKRYRKPPKGWRFFHLNTELNTALAEGWAKDFLDGVPSDMRETRRIGLFASFRGAVFKDFRYDQHVVPEFAIPADAYRIRGIDFGFTAPFACVWLARMPRSIRIADGRLVREGTWVVYHEHVAAETLLHDHATAIKDFEPWGSRSELFGPTVADHDSQDAAELRAEGVPTVPADKTPYSVSSGIYAMKKLMLGGDANNAPRFVVFESCEKSIACIQGYRYDAGTAHRDSLEIPVKKDDHEVDAIRYALSYGLKSRGEFPSEDVKPMRSEWRQTAATFLGG